jgi:hypothetical protein
LLYWRVLALHIEHVLVVSGFLGFAEGRVLGQGTKDYLLVRRILDAAAQTG